eukprot:TRINITY_DN1936_c2_g4_i1.p2 TRINITY_DN1936_c2_g4~~TRINITY_DN1936_c2_g4_i1.p2  ORF type:complete len:101 (-),score=21.44 TRINITY_DN1936_c2_g4_i1:510-812(-)
MLHGCSLCLSINHQMLPPGLNRSKRHLAAAAACCTNAHNQCSRPGTVTAKASADDDSHNVTRMFALRQAAVEQCAGDEEFLRELLLDLWNELQEHLEEVR